MFKNSNLTALLIGVLQLFLGIWMIFADINILSIIFKVVGIAFLIVGAIQMAQVLLNHRTTSYAESGLVSGALNIAIGIILITKLTFAVGVLTIIIGFWILVNGILQVSSSITLKNLGLKYWPLVSIIGVIGAVLGYMLVVADAETTQMIINTHIGISIAINGLGTTLTAFSSTKE